MLLIIVYCLLSILVKTVGCYRDVGYIDGKRPFPQYKNFRDDINWDAYMQSLNETVFKCASYAREHKFEVSQLSCKFSP